MSKKEERKVVPLIIQGRSYTGKSSIKNLILFILEYAIKCSGQNRFT